MPIYEYRCEQCGHQLDALQKVSDAPLADCPECQSASLRKLVSAPNFRLKGSGWYETDFKGDKDQKRNLHGADSEAKSDKADGKDTPAADGKKEQKSAKDNKTDKAEAKSAKKAEAST